MVLIYNYMLDKHINQYGLTRMDIGAHAPGQDIVCVYIIVIHKYL